MLEDTNLLDGAHICYATLRYFAHTSFRTSDMAYTYFAVDAHQIDGHYD